MDKAKKDKLIKVVGAIAVIGVIVKIALTVHSGRMYVLWPNIVLIVCGLMVISVIGFWVYAWIKGIDSVFKDELRGGE
jgi:hypothetical protein